MVEHTATILEGVGKVTKCKFALSKQNVRICLVSCVAVLALFSLSSYAQGVDVRGRIVDYTNTGMPGATVWMVKADLTTTTDADGYFDFSSTTSVQLDNSSSRKLPISSALQFVTDGKTSVSASLFNLQGKQVARIDNHTAAAGMVSLRPLFSNVGDGLFIAKVQIGQQTESIKVSRIDNAIRVLNNRIRSERQATTDLVQTSEIVEAQDEVDWSIKDTLRITKTGHYEQYAYVRRYPEYINALIHHHKNHEKLRFSTATAPALAEVYSECDYKGEKISFEEEGYYGADDLNALGIENSDIQSMKVAPGYRLRIINKNGTYFIKPEDDECFVDDRNMDLGSLHVERIPDSVLNRHRPRIFVAFHGLNELVNYEDENWLDGWEYVQEHLDGIWHNAHRFPTSRRAAMFDATQTRVIKNELPNQIPNVTYPDQFDITPRPYLEGAYFYRKNLDHEGLYTDMTNYWRTVNDSLHPDRTSWKHYNGVMLGFQPGPFGINEDGLTQIENSEFINTFHESDGVFIETPYQHGMLGPAYRTIVNAAHLTHQDRPGKSFVLFISKMGWLDTPEGQARWVQTIKNRYYKYEDAGIFTPNDVIALVFYRPGDEQNMPGTPEVDPETGRALPTITGMLYWMLNQ